MAGLLALWWALSTAVPQSFSGDPSTENTAGIAFGVIAACLGCAVFLVGLHRDLTQREALAALLTERLLHERDVAPTSPPVG
ncbi:MAG TPA: hypothetical protein VGK35_01510 [Actinotalea sp.]